MAVDALGIISAVINLPIIGKPVVRAGAGSRLSACARARAAPCECRG